MVEITDADVDKEMQRVFRQNRGYEPKSDDGVVADGDNLGISFVGKIDGKPFEGGSSDHAHVIVGAGEFIPGFEEQLVGMKKGETRSIDVTFPARLQPRRAAGQEGRRSTSPCSTSMRRRPASSTTISPSASASTTSRRCATRCATR